MHMGAMLVKMVALLQTFPGKFFLHIDISLFCVQLVILVLCICSFREGLDLVKEAISRTGYNEKIKIGIEASLHLSSFIFLYIFLPSLFQNSLTKSLTNNPMQSESHVLWWLQMVVGCGCDLGRRRVQGGYGWSGWCCFSCGCLGYGGGGGDVAWKMQV